MQHSDFLECMRAHLLDLLADLERSAEKHGPSLAYSNAIQEVKWAMRSLDEADGRACASLIFTAGVSAGNISRGAYERVKKSRHGQRKGRSRRDFVLEKYRTGVAAGKWTNPNQAGKPIVDLIREDRRFRISVDDSNAEKTVRKCLYDARKAGEIN